MEKHKTKKVYTPCRVMIIDDGTCKCGKCLKKNKNKNKRILFVCAYAQSRSKCFSEKFMVGGIMSLFCGYLDGADFKLNKDYIEWADIIILLDKDIKREIHYDVLINSQKQIIEYYIEDEPSLFEEKIIKLKEIIFSELSKK